MTNTLEKQYVVSRARTVFDQFKPWKWFDSRKEARSFKLAKENASDRWEYRIDAVTRGPRS